MKQSGFTLLELMIVVVIIAILAVVAIPSYKRYIVRNSEDEAKQRMMTLANELDAWSSNSFSYRGFVPKSGYADASSSKQTLYTTNKKYTITMVDYSDAGGIQSLADDSASGRIWRMKAVPDTSLFALEGARTFYVDALNRRCSFNVGASVALNTTTTSTHICEESAAQAW